eukprot:1151901-Pelagomonas_calceolata.AAC.2
MMCAYAKRSCPPCPGVWMREPLVRSLHGAHSAVHACMLERGMVCCRKVLLLPQTLHTNATSVLGRAGFAVFQHSLRRFPHLSFLHCYENDGKLVLAMENGF